MQFVQNVYISKTLESEKKLCWLLVVITMNYWSFLPVKVFPIKIIIIFSMQNNLLDCHMLIVVTSIEVIKEATFFQPGTDANEEITLEMLASGK